CVGFVPMLFARTFSMVFAGWAAYAMFAVAVGGLADAFAVARVRAGAVYGRLRLWGSIGYVVAAVLVGAPLAAGGRAAERLMTFGMFWSAAIALVTATVPASLRATGQALLIMSINVGAALGNTITGRLYDAYGSRLLFLLAAIGELAPLAVVLATRRRLRDPAALISSCP